MKTLTRTLIITAIILLSNFVTRADWELYGPVTPPGLGATYWSLAHGTSYPPTPCIPLLFFESPVYQIVNWPGNYTYDDTENPDHQQLTSDGYSSNGSSGGGSGDDPQPMVDYGTNLWIEIVNLTNQLSDAGTQQVANLFLHNTTAGTVYEIISSVNPSVPMSNWVSEGLWLAPGTNTPTPVPIWTRTNELCFRGRVWDGSFSHGVATNGQLYLLCQDTNTIQGVINGVTNPITPIYSNWAVLNPPVWTANFGFSGDDLGPTNYFSQFTQQNLHAVLSFSRSISNLALSFDPISKIDTHGWPNLTYLEMWHATNLVAVSVTNCPKLYRVCFESIDGDGLMNGIKDVLDFTGCTNLADLRAANNNITNIILGPNGGSNIWHFCTRDARSTNRTPPIIKGVPFKSLPSLKQLWIFGDYSFVDNIVLTVTNAPNLESVEAQGNFFQSLDVTGQTNLDHVFVESNPGLTNLTVTGCSNLVVVTAGADSLPTATVDSILTNLDAMGLHSDVNHSYLHVEVQGGFNQAPSVNGMRSVRNLLNKGWSANWTPPAPGTPNISNLAVSRTSTNTTISWTTDVSSDSTVYYSTDTSFGSSSNVATLTTSHSVTLLGLAPNTTYNYYVHSTSGTLTGTSGDNQFKTVNANAIWFTNISTTVAMQVLVVSGATVNWYWGDGTNDTGTNASHTFVNAGSYSNAVVVDPDSALLGFGASCDNESSAATTLTSVSGLTNYPKLASLLLVNSHLSNLSLAGCSNLTQIALVHTSPSTNVENGWFTELATAQQAGFVPNTVTPPCGELQHYFYCPANPGATNRSVGSAYYTLTNSLGWTIVEFGGAQ